MIREYIIENNKGNYNPNLKKWKEASVEVEQEVDVDLRRALQIVDGLVPERFLRIIDKIRIGDYPELTHRNMDAITHNDDEIILSSEYENLDPFVNAIIHEIGHIVENFHEDDIYNDDALKREFKRKREKLFIRLKHEGYEVDKKKVVYNLRYNKSLDNFLWKEIGYDFIAQLTHDLFLNPYSATSLREYWAVAFQNYFRGNPRDVEKYCPNALRKIKKLMR